MSRRRQYGGQTNQTNQSVDTIAALEKAVEEKQAALKQAQQDYNAANSNYKAKVQVQAQKSKEYEQKLKNEQNATSLVSTKTTSRNTAKTLKTAANTNYNTAVAKQTELEAEVSAKKAAYNLAEKEQVFAKAKKNAADQNVASQEALQKLAAANVALKELDVPAKRAVFNVSEFTEARLYDPSFLSGLHAWFDASKLTGAPGSAITTWKTSPSSLEIALPQVQFTGTGTILTSSTANPVVRLASNQTLTMSPAPVFETFTLLFVTRQVGPTNGRVLQGTNTSYGYVNGKQDSLILGTTQFVSTNPSDTNWDIYTIVRNTNTSGGFYKFGAVLNEFTASESGMNGLTINTSEPSDCEIGEIVLYNRALNSNEMRMIEGMLARKWKLKDSLPKEHPYKDVYPELLPPTGGRRKRRRKTKKLRKAKKRRYTRR